MGGFTNSFIQSFNPAFEAGTGQGAAAYRQLQQEQATAMQRAQQMNDPAYQADQQWKGVQRQMEMGRYRNMQDDRELQATQHELGRRLMEDTYGSASPEYSTYLVNGHIPMDRPDLPIPPEARLLDAQIRDREAQMREYNQSVSKEQAQIATIQRRMADPGWEDFRNPAAVKDELQAHNDNLLSLYRKGEPLQAELAAARQQHIEILQNAMQSRKGRMGMGQQPGAGMAPPAPPTTQPSVAQQLPPGLGGMPAEPVGLHSGHPDSTPPQMQAAPTTQPVQAAPVAMPAAPPPNPILQSMGMQPAQVQGLPPAPESMARQIKEAAMQHSDDPVTQRRLAYQMMIQQGFNPLAAPVPDPPK